jgi:hypothetical protein
LTKRSAHARGKPPGLSLSPKPDGRGWHEKQPSNGIAGSQEPDDDGHYDRRVGQAENNHDQSIPPQVSAVKRTLPGPFSPELEKRHARTYLPGMDDRFDVIDCDTGKWWRLSDEHAAIRYAAGLHAATGNVVEVLRSTEASVEQRLVLPPDAPIARS